MNRRVLGVFFFLVIPLVSAELAAHNAHSQQRPETSLSASAAGTFRSKVAVAPGQPRLIPGVMMGGEAFAVEKGATIDDVNLHGVWANSEHFSVHSKLMAHQHHGEAEFELEGLWLAIDSSDIPLGVQFAMGKMATRITPSATWHASTSNFSEASLLSDVFWGRHFSDTGIALSKSYNGFVFGLEAWNGDSWPASLGKGSADAYIHYSGAVSLFKINTGLWAMASRAEARSDTRYASGHSHGGRTIVNPAGDFVFSGDVTSRGGFLSCDTNVAQMTVGAKIEFIAQSYEGTLNNSNQSSAYEADHQGTRFEFSANYQRHTLSASYESLSFENRFYGSVSELFVTDAGLMNNGFEPQKIALAWNYQWKPELKFRTEWVADSSQSDDSVDRWNVGFVWQRDWLY